MKKNGMIAFVTILNIIFALLVVTCLFFGAVTLGGSAKARNRLVLAKDVALGVDAAFGTMQDAKVSVNYPNTVRDREVVAQDNMLSVYPVGKENAMNPPAHPYTQNAYYAPLKEKATMDVLVFAKDKHEVALHSLTSVIAGPIEGVDTKADPATQQVRVTSGDADVKAAVEQALSVEGFAVAAGTPTLTITIGRGADQVVKVKYGNADAALTKRERKLSELMKASFGEAILLEDLTASDTSPAISVQIPQGLAAQDVGSKVAIAVSRYFS